MPTMNLPLSGDVSQVIDPWTLFVRSIGTQFGLINISVGESSDPEMEKQIIQTVGSYGKQLGQIGDALRVLIDHCCENKQLSEEDERILRKFKDQMEKIDEIKSRKLR